MGVIMIDGFDQTGNANEAFVCASNRIANMPLYASTGFANADLVRNDQLREVAEVTSKDANNPAFRFDASRYDLRGLVIASHNLGTARAEIRIGFWKDEAWRWPWRGEISSDEPIVFLFPKQKNDHIYIQVMNNADTRALCKVGYIRGLLPVHMGRPDQYSARVPQASVGSFSSNVPLSGVGVPLLQIRRAPTATRRFAFRNLTRNFAEKWIAELRRYMVNGFMVAGSDPLNSPDDVAFGWCAGVPPEPVPQGEADLFSWEFKMGCYLG